MKNLLIIFTLLVQTSFAQTDVVFQINHLLNGNSNFSLSSKGQNNLGTNFTLSRMQYYISNISIKHDGGQNLNFDDTTILVDAYTSTIINLGNFNVTNLESVYFNLGVDQSLNYLDPATYPMNHPLAPKSPSMHWGWTSGYRFFAFEGFAQGQVFELHGVGDALNEEITVNFTETSAENNLITIDVNAEYNGALKDLDLASGFSVHGDENDTEIVTGVTNYKNNIFSANEGTIGVPNNLNDLNAVNDYLNVFPSPTKGEINVSKSSFTSLLIYNSVGEIIANEFNSSHNIYIKSKGIHFLHFFDEKNNLISINKVVVY